jgi:hypothetical protein
VKLPLKLPLLLLLGILLVVCIVYVFARQERARRVVVNGNGTITVKAGGDVQAALERARPGDTILLEAGATFRGALNLPNKPGAEYITIRSNAPDAQLPAPGTRLDPARYAAALPKIISETRGEAAVTATNGAHHYRFIAVEFGPTPKGEGNIIALGTTEEKSFNDLPHDIELDRVYVHGSPTEGQRRGVALNGRRMRVLNSYFADMKRKGEESQAICGWGGDGPFEIINNYLEGAAQGVLFGGATSPLQVVPSDIIVRGNHFNKPLHWREEGWIVKNQFELKSARRVKVENNLITNCWAKGQTGIAILFTAANDSGSWAMVEDVEFTNNIIRGAGGGINMQGQEAKGGRRVTVRNNIFDDISGERWGGDGEFLKVTDWDGLVIENNTIVNSGAITKAYGEPVKGFIFRHNIVPQNEYGFVGDGQSPGQPALDTYFPGSTVVYNAIIGGEASRLKERNMYPASLKQLKFVNLEGGDYRLQADSPLKKAGTNGADIGANLDPQTVGRVR